MNPAHVIAPADVAAQRMSASQIAVYQQIYANDNLAAAYEILSLSGNPADRALLFQVMLKWGYRPLEQGLTSEFVKKNPQSFLRHHLNRLQTNLGMAVQNSWTEHAVSQTLYSRYPWYFKTSGAKSLPIGLRCIREANSDVVKEFEAKAQDLMVENMAMQHTILVHHAKDKQEPHLTLIQNAFKTFQTASRLPSNKEVDVKANNEAHTENAAILEKLENKFVTPMQNCKAALDNLSKNLAEAFLAKDQEKILSIQNAQNALLNARHHLININGAIGLLKRFPQQRFTHVLLDFIHSSGKDFVENLGAFLSIKGENPLYTHSLDTYMKEHELGKNLKADAKKVIANSDVHKGDEYPYKYFSKTPPKLVSPHMTLLSELYKSSREAVLLGEGTATSGGLLKSNDLAEKAGLFAKSIAEMVCGLANKHF
jgi:hypothetical protein